jgi:hypothetical protein
VLMAPAARFTSASVIDAAVVAPFAACGAEKVEFAVVFASSVVDGANAATKLRFLQSPAVDLAASLTDVLGVYSATALELDIAPLQGVERVRAKFTIVLNAGVQVTASTLSDALLGFRDGKIVVADQYLGASRFMIDPANGATCECGGTCEGSIAATCKDVSGKKMDCPCVEGYSGSGILEIFEFVYDGLLPVSRDMAVLHPAGFNDGDAASAEYRKYRLSVRATDAVGVQGPPAHYDWFVDTSAPNTGLTSLPLTTGPFAVLTDPAAEFGFVSDGWIDRGPSVLSGTGDSVGFNCRLEALCWPETQLADGSTETCEHGTIVSDEQLAATHAWQPCNGGGASRRQLYTNLPDGRYTFAVAAEDQAGNSDQTPVVSQFVVDASPPTATVVDLVVLGQRMAAGFVGSKPGCTFNCTVTHHVTNVTGNVTTVDSMVVARLEGCQSPYLVEGLPLGNVTFEVTATDVEGRLSVLVAAADFVTFAVGQNVTVTASASTVCAPTQDKPVKAALAAIWIIVAIVGLAVGVSFYLADRVIYPLGRSKATTRAFHNPSFGLDVPVSRRMSVSNPTDFQHIQSGFISNPTDFQHIAHHGRGASSPSFGITQNNNDLPLVGDFHNEAAKMIKRNEAKQRARPSFPGALSISSPEKGSFRHVSGYGLPPQQPGDRPGSRGAGSVPGGVTMTQLL